MKVIKKTFLKCNLCKGKWRLDKVELANGDKCLRCFHCRPNLRLWTNNTKTLVFANPYEQFKASFSSIEEEINMCTEIRNELD